MAETNIDARLKALESLINTPELDGFLRGTHIEAVHQVERWGTAHDRAKRPADWFWLVGYLAGKALHAATKPVLQCFRHKKRGSTYELLGTATLQASDLALLRDGEPMAVYRGDDGSLHVRHHTEFHDGRFEEVAPAPDEKALHHCISTAAALYNWHCSIKGVDVRMCPGRSDIAEVVDRAFPGEANG